MIALESFSGRFGNKVIAYNNLRQIALFMNDEWYSPPWEGEQIFENNTCSTDRLMKLPVFRPSLELLLQDEAVLRKELQDKLVIIDPTYLGNLTFKFMKSNPREFLKDPVEKIKSRVSIHFRGTDFFHWNPLSILPFEYYRDAIDYCSRYLSNPEFVVFTDDKGLDSYCKTLELLEKRSFVWSLGPSESTGNFIHDFQEIAKSEIIISSPSTFAISAGIVGNCSVIHSKSWISSQASAGDTFWVNLRNSSTPFYRLIAEI